MEKQRKGSKKVFERYQNLSEEVKNKSHQYGSKHCKYFPEDEKQRLV